jgi:hypothetical protein
VKFLIGAAIGAAVVVVLVLGVIAWINVRQWSNGPDSTSGPADE